MNIVKFAGCAAVAALLAGCAQQEEPATMVPPQPVFDKYGGGSCEGNWVYVPGAVPELAECVPPDDCEYIIDSTGQTFPCPPPNQRPIGTADAQSDGSAVVRTPNTPVGTAVRP